ncbi:MAG: carboxypeptidase-like regulatory domain-containing protein [Acidobacteriota bacterium]
MKSASKLFRSIFVLSLLAIATLAQTATNKATGTIAGRVTVGTQPAPGVDVLLKAGGNPSPTDILQSSPSATATTDADGWYRLTGVAPGSYRVVAYAPAHVVEGNANPFMPGKPVNVAEGEAVENINFSITRGGVVTGTVTDPDGRPMIAEAVKAHKLDENGKRQKGGAADFDIAGLSGLQTDDRGVYRIYGLEPGRYIISAGASSEAAMLQMATAGGAYYQRTFYPEATDEAKAKIIEIKSGDEIESVDIKLARAGRDKSFAATGRVIEAESGKPVAGMMIMYSITKEGSASFGFGNSTTNSQGEFRLGGLTPNSYQAFVVGLEQTENYGEPVKFEVGEGDVSGLEIKMNLGASISGVAVIEGVSDPSTVSKLREKLSKIQITAQVIEKSEGVVFSNTFGSAGQISANGTFKLGGLKPGKVQLIVNTFMAEKGFTPLRIEQNGVEMKEIQLTAGVPATGVRIIFAYGTASIAGRVEVRGGSLPPGARLSVRVVREDGSEPLFNTLRGDVDERGQFLIEGIFPGRHKLIMGSYENPSLPKVEQFITITGNGRQEVVLPLNLPKKEEK